MTEAECVTRYADAAAALLSSRGRPPPAPTSLIADDERREQLATVAATLEAQVEQAATQIASQAARRAHLREKLEQCSREAGKRSEEIAAAVQALAGRLACLGAGSSQFSAPLLGFELPDSYAAACRTLLDNLSGYLLHNFPECGSSTFPNNNVSVPGNPSAAAYQHQAAAVELEQLQACAIKSERLRVEEEAELARLQAELEVLHAPSPTAGAASLGYSTADLEAEVASLQRRRASSLQTAVAVAEAAAATAAGAEVVEEQAAARQAALEQRLHAKRQVAQMLIRHLARQLLVQRLLRHEREMLAEVEATVAAARQDAETALQAVQARLSGYQHGADKQASQTRAEAVRKEAALATAASQQHQQAEEEQDPLATAQQLLACRAKLQQLSEQLHSQSLPAHVAVFGNLHGLLHGSDGSNSSTPASASDMAKADGGSNTAGRAAGASAALELSPAVLTEQLTAVAATEAALSLQVESLLGEVIARQQAPAERQLAETVLQLFWAQPERLPALAEKQQRQLATYTAG